MRSSFQGSHAEMLALVVLCAFCPRGFLASQLGVSNDFKSSTTPVPPYLKAPITRPQLDLRPGESFRNNFCDRQAQVENGTRNLTDALDGMNISVHLMDWKLGKTIKYDNNGILDDNDPGLFVNILDEVAKRAGFQWRDSFGVGLTPSMDLKHPDATFTDVLNWGVDTYDISIGEWRNSRERKGLGIFFPLGFVDASLIMVQKKYTPGFRPFRFLDVFSGKVWLLIIAIYILSAVIYRFIHKYGKGEDVNNTGTKGINLFSALMYFNQQHEFSPKSCAGRIFTFSMSFFSMLIISAYTANLVSVLVSKDNQIIIQSYKDAERSGKKVCVLKNSSAHKFLEIRYPASEFFEAKSKDKMYDFLNSGKCDIVSDTVWSWQEYERDEEFNTDCSLVQVGQRAEVSQRAGMAVQANRTTCTSLLSRVLDYHLSCMNEEKILEKEQQKYLGKERTCENKKRAETHELDLKQLSGLFIFHGTLMILALVVVVYENGWSVRRERKGQNRFSCLKQSPSRSLFVKEAVGMPNESVRDITKHNMVSNVGCSHSNDISKSDYFSQEDIAVAMEKVKNDVFKEFTASLQSDPSRWSRISSYQSASSQDEIAIETLNESQLSGIKTA
uniref:Ionotropic glutamate receptor C-terminal domain-containing protein n=1 Tax=Chaetoceros debilis TaxID=122233 RepID=A0A7S3VGG4_9STRA|mmetsp:Transcript_13378/g.19503  ORF Transcript_13378/g.19503 Transcript_13378/m.19503 type:complete len:614 (+) Transcript_13378:167-2008(+)